jgi:hypothetical protein
VEIVNEGSKLRIKVKKYLAKDFTVNIYCPNILGLTIDTVGEVEFVDKMVTPSLKININGAGKITGTLECNSLSAAINGAGAIEISGSSAEARVSINGAGSFSGYEFKVSNGTFNMNGAGSIKCWAVDNLTAGVSGVGSIRYRGDPHVNSTKSGLGSIRKAE